MCSVNIVAVTFRSVLNKRLPSWHLADGTQTGVLLFSASRHASVPGLCTRTVLVQESCTLMCIDVNSYGCCCIALWLFVHRRKRCFRFLPLVSTLDSGLCADFSASHSSRSCHCALLMCPRCRWDWQMMHCAKVCAADSRCCRESDPQGKGDGEQRRLEDLDSSKRLGVFRAVHYIAFVKVGQPY